MSALRYEAVRLVAGADAVALSFEVAPGETVVLPGGLARYQALAAALGLARPASGEVRTLGLDPFALDPGALRALRGRCAMVPHSGLLVANADVRTNVALPLLYHEPTRDPGVAARVAARADAALAELGLLSIATARPAAVSYPLQRLVAFARARAARVEVLLAQDPYEGLDEPMAARVEAALDALAADGCAALITTSVVRAEASYGGRLGPRPGRRVVDLAAVHSAR